MTKTRLKKQGYTFIELLVVLIVLITVGALALSVLIATLRGSSKTVSLTQTRQNGNYAISIMSQMIRDAAAFNGVSTDPSFLSPVTSCVGSTALYKSISITNFDGHQTTFSCSTINNAPTVASNSASLIDTSTFSVTSCSFTCTQNTQLDYPTIGIYLTIRPSTSLDSASAIPFETTVTMRNNQNQ